MNVSSQEISSQAPNTTHPRLLVPFFFVAPSVAALILSFLYRNVDDANYSLILFEGTGLLMFLQFIPWIFQYHFNCKGHGPLKAWYQSSSFFLLVGILVTCGTIQISNFGWGIGWFITLMGWLFYIYATIQLIKNDRGSFFLGFFILYMLFFISMTDTTSLLFDKIIQNGINEDALFHSAIANMINTYGTPSTGFNGIPYIHYHIGSHWIFAQLSKLYNLPMYLTYQIFWGMVLAPQIFSAMFYFILDYKELQYKTINNWDMLRDWKFLLLFMVIFYGASHFSFIKYMPFITTNFGSESWGLSIGLSVIYLSLIIYFFRENYFFENKKSLNKVSNWFFCCLIFPLLLSLVGFLKVSVMFILLMMSFYAYIRLTLYKHLIFNVAILISSIVFFLTFHAVNPASINSHPVQALFFQWDNWATPDIRPFFLQIYCFWAWVYLLVRLLQLKINSLADLKTAFLNKNILDIEFLLVLCIVCLLPGNLIRIDGGSYVYFSDYQIMWSTCFLLGIMPIVFAKKDTHKLRKRFADTPIINLILIFSFIPYAHQVASNVVEKLSAIKWKNLHLTPHPINTKLTAKEKSKLNIMNSVAINNNKIFQYPKYDLFRLVDQLNKIPLEEKRKTLVFVKPNEELKKLTQLGHCEFASFVIPALAGIALIEGVPVSECLDAIPSGGKSVLVSSYLSGYSEKEYNTSTNFLNQLTPEKLCTEVVKKGFTQLVVFDIAKTKEPITKYTCKKMSS